MVLQVDRQYRVLNWPGDDRKPRCPPPAGLQPMVGLLETNESIAQPVTRSRATSGPPRSTLLEGLPVFFTIVGVPHFRGIYDPREPIGIRWGTNQQGCSNIGREGSALRVIETMLQSKDGMAGGRSLLCHRSEVGLQASLPLF